MGQTDGRFTGPARSLDVADAQREKAGFVGSPAEREINPRHVHWINGPGKTHLFKTVPKGCESVMTKEIRSLWVMGHLLVMGHGSLAIHSQSFADQPLGLFDCY